MQQDGVFRLGNQYLTYFLSKKDSDKLVIVFPSVDSMPGYNRMSYFKFSSALNTNTLHLVDNFGTHGSYFLDFNDSTRTTIVKSLIEHLIEKLNIDLSNTYFVGTSKGGYSAIYFSLLIGGGNVIAGEPQVMLGDFLFNSWRTSESARSIIYTIAARISETDRVKLNKVLIELFKSQANSYFGKMKILYGSKTGYYDEHIRFIEELLSQEIFDENKIRLESFNIANHNDIVPIFIDTINELNKYLATPNAKSSPFFIVEEILLNPSPHFLWLNKQFKLSKLFFNKLVIKK